IDFPLEYLTGISGKHGRWGSFPNLITSLKFHTNRTQYGPFGEGASGNPFSFITEGGVITGCHGRAGRYLDAIGVYIKPARSLSRLITVEQHPQLNVRNPGLLTQSAGPFPGCITGRAWDDGVFSAVKAVHVHVSSDMSVVSGVQFLYEKRDGCVVLSPLHGAPSEDIVKTFEIDGESEFLIGVDGFHGCVDGVKVIRSIRFVTNKGKYGPMGYEFGEYFCSITSMAITGKVVGFFGESSACLNAIGVHTEYF
ncbi:agglutinin, partial [Phtheirospermum japonicum]